MRLRYIYLLFLFLCCNPGKGQLFISLPIVQFSSVFTDATNLKDSIIIRLYVINAKDSSGNPIRCKTSENITLDPIYFHNHYSDLKIVRSLQWRGKESPPKIGTLESGNYLFYSEIWSQSCARIIGYGCTETSVEGGINQDVEIIINRFVRKEDTVVRACLANEFCNENGLCEDCNMSKDKDKDMVEDQWCLESPSKRGDCNDYSDKISPNHLPECNSGSDYNCDYKIDDWEDCISCEELSLNYIDKISLTELQGNILSLTYWRDYLIVITESQITILDKTQNYKLLKEEVVGPPLKSITKDINTVVFNDYLILPCKVSPSEYSIALYKLSEDKENPIQFVKNWRGYQKFQEGGDILFTVNNFLILSESDRFYIVDIKDMEHPFVLEEIEVTEEGLGTQKGIFLYYSYNLSYLFLCDFANGDFMWYKFNPTLGNTTLNPEKLDVKLCYGAIGIIDSWQSISENKFYLFTLNSWERSQTNKTKIIEFEITNNNTLTSPNPIFYEDSYEIKPKFLFEGESIEAEWEDLFSFKVAKNFILTVGLFRDNNNTIDNKVVIFPAQALIDYANSKTNIIEIRSNHFYRFSGDPSSYSIKRGVITIESNRLFLPIKEGNIYYLYIFSLCNQ